MLNGILWILRTGSPWRDLPERFGPWQTVYDEFATGRTIGAYDRILEALHVRLDAAGEIDWDLWCIDGSSVRASRAAADSRSDGRSVFDKQASKRRSIVEQTIGWLKKCRRIGTRFEKRHQLPCDDEARNDPKMPQNRVSRQNVERDDPAPQNRDWSAKTFAFSAGHDEGHFALPKRLPPGFRDLPRSMIASYCRVSLSSSNFTTSAAAAARLTGPQTSHRPANVCGSTVCRPIPGPAGLVDHVGRPCTRLLPPAAVRGAAPFRHESRQSRHHDILRHVGCLTASSHP